MSVWGGGWERARIQGPCMFFLGSRVTAFATQECCFRAWKPAGCLGALSLGCVGVWLHGIWDGSAKGLIARSGDVSSHGCSATSVVLIG